MSTLPRLLRRLQKINRRRRPLKAGDLVVLRCFPPIGMGTGAKPKCGVITRPVTTILSGAGKPTTWWVLLDGKEYKLHSAGLEVISKTK